MTPLPEITYGPWRPTNYLRWNGDVLEQQMRRKTKYFTPQGPAYRGGYEYEWQPVPRLDL